MNESLSPRRDALPDCRARLVPAVDRPLVHRQPRRGRVRRPVGAVDPRRGRVLDRHGEAGMTLDMVLAIAGVGVTVLVVVAMVLLVPGNTVEDRPEQASAEVVGPASPAASDPPGEATRRSSSVAETAV